MTEKPIGPRPSSFGEIMNTATGTKQNWITCEGCPMFAAWSFQSFYCRHLDNYPIRTVTFPDIVKAKCGLETVNDA